MVFSTSWKLELMKPLEPFALKREIGMVLLGMVDARVNEIAVFGAAST